MGLCFSTPAQPDAAGAYDKGVAPGRAPVGVDDGMRLLAKVNKMMQNLNQVSQTPVMALPEFAKIVVEQLGADMCNIHGVVEDGSSNIPMAMLLASYGKGSELLLKRPAVRDSSCSPLLLRGPHDVLCVQSAKEELATGSLSTDWAMLHKEAGLCSFLAVPVSTGGDRVLGTLCIGGAQEGSFGGEQWASVLGTAASSLLQHLRTPQVSYLCGLMAALDATTAPEDFVNCLLHGAATFMAVSAGTRVGARLGMVDQQRKEALLLERNTHLCPADAATAANAGEVPGAPPTAYTPSPPGSRVVCNAVALDNTLLYSAMYVNRPRCVKDCAQYFQSCQSPAADVFTPTSLDLVAAVVVAPICFENSIVGGLYFTLDKPGDFSFMRHALTGLVELLSPLVYHRLAGDSVIRSLRERTLQVAAPDSEPPLDPTAASTSQPARSSSALNKQLCTQAILKAVQQKLMTSHTAIAGRRGSKPGDGGEFGITTLGEDSGLRLGITLESVIGRGGFGVCYKATYKRGPVAVKVMYARKDEKEAMKDAVEMAVLSQMSHPHIVQVYDCLTNVFEEPAPIWGGAELGTSPPTMPGMHLPTYRRLSPQEEARGVVGCSMIIMEYMDCGTLRDAIRRGVFHRQVNQNALAVDLVACIKVLQELAMAVEHLHSRNLMHCDIKPENVLLRSDATRQLEFVCKLADFGLVKMIRGSKQYVINRSGTGTITHLPPEALLPGAKLTTAVDVYAFGILMYELYSGQRAYPGLRLDDIMEHVMRGGLRPTFPPGSPESYITLAQRCWSADPAKRPKFWEIVPALDRVLADATPPADVAPAGPRGAAGSQGLQVLTVAMN